MQEANHFIVHLVDLSLALNRLIKKRTDIRFTDSRPFHGSYLVLVATGLPVLTFDPISLHHIGTMLTVAGSIHVASCSFSCTTAAFADCEKDLLWLCPPPMPVQD